MEAFGIVDKLQELATAKGWLFLNGDNFYANIDADAKINVNQLVLWVDLNATPGRARGNALTRINYTGFIALGRKKESESQQASLDESKHQKYNRRLKELLQVLADELKAISCANNLQIVAEDYVYDINTFDTNIDFVVGNVNIEQEVFDVGTTYKLDVAIDGDGVTSPIAGSYTKKENETVQLIAAPNAGNEFTKWVINSVDYLQPVVNLVVDGAKSATAYFNLIGKLIHQFVSEDRPRKENYDYDSLFTGSIISVTNVSELESAINTANSNDIIELADGTYDVSNFASGYMLLNNQKNLQFRSVSNDFNLCQLINTVASGFGVVRLRNSGITVFKNISIIASVELRHVFMNYEFSNRTVIFDGVYLENTFNNVNTSLFELTDSVAGITDKYVEFKDCIFYNQFSTYDILVQNQGINNEYLFDNCKCHTNNVPFYYRNTALGKVYVYDCDFKSLANSGYIMGFGEDTNLPIYSNNSIDIRSNTANRADGTAGHGILLGRGLNDVYCVNNIIQGTNVEDSLNIGLVVKSTGLSLSDCIIKGNYINSYRPLYIKGGRYNDIQYNTASALGNLESLGFVNVLDEGQGEELSNDNRITNNNLIGGDYGINLREINASEDIVTTAKTCDIDNNKYYFTINYLRDGKNTLDIIFADKAVFWGNGNDDNSEVVSISQLPVELP
jgi:hypothetical protein